MPEPPGTPRLIELLSAHRMAPYLVQSGGSEQTAMDLYAWGARLAAACFEVVGHFEVLLRNAIDDQLRRYYHEDRVGIPWFLLADPLDDVAAAPVEAVRLRLRPQGRESRDQIIAGLSYGFWAGLLGVKYEELWRQCLHRAFPNSRGTRKQVATAVEAIRKFRNRLAHHDSMLGLDVPFEIRRVIEATRYIDHGAADWLHSVDRTPEVYASRPVQVKDTVVVAAASAWPFYERHRAYYCQPGRWFRPVERIAFYCDRAIQPDVPLIRGRRDHVACSEQEYLRLSASADREDRKVAAVLRACLDEGLEWMGAIQVFLLSRPGDPEHRRLESALPHEAVGRGSAFTQRQRYVSLHQLQVSRSTSDVN